MEVLEMKIANKMAREFVVKTIVKCFVCGYGAKRLTRTPSDSHICSRCEKAVSKGRV